MRQRLQHTIMRWKALQYGIGLRTAVRPHACFSLETHHPIQCDNASGLDIIRRAHPDGLIEIYRDVLITGHHPLAYSPSGKPIYSSAEEATRNYRANKNFQNNKKNSQKPLRFEKAILLDNGYGHFGHWIFEQLPRIIRAKNLEDYTVIVNRGEPATFEKELLSTLGRKDIVVFDGTPIRVNNYAQVACPLLSGKNVESLQQFASNLPTSNSPKRLFLSRQGLTRRITNFSQILPILKKYDVHVWSPQKERVLDQIPVFRHAELIIGLHGSALRNAIFMQSGHVVEIHGSFMEYGQKALLHHAPAQYHSLISASPSTKSSGVSIDPGLLDEFLNELL